MISLVILISSAVLLLIATIWKRKSPAWLREIPAFTRLHRALGLSVEDGTRLHVSLGNGNPLDARGGSAFAGLAMLRIIAERTALGDKPVVASTGDAVLGLLTQDTLRAGNQTAGADDLYVPTLGRVTGLTPFGYAAGAMHISQNEDVSANIMLGHFSSEVALLADASDRDNVTMIGASDNLAGQAVLFANTQDVLIGEELFAAGAYLHAGAAHTASLAVQDVLRWLVIAAILGGAFAKFVGII